MIETTEANERANMRIGEQIKAAVTRITQGILGTNNRADEHVKTAEARIIQADEQVKTALKSMVIGITKANEQANMWIAKLEGCSLQGSGENQRNLPQ